MPRISTKVKQSTEAAEKGDAEAQFDLGRRYYEGDGVMTNQAESFNWFRKAGEQGHAEAQYRLT
ncbi:MAG: hypothetical protein WCH99_13905 [Verrucomicrobiota bacterium]